MKGLERRTTTLNLSQINESLKCLFGIIPAARERERERERERMGNGWQKSILVVVVCRHRHHHLSLSRPLTPSS